MECSMNALTLWRLEKARKTLFDAQQLYQLEMYQFCLIALTMLFFMLCRLLIASTALIQGSILA